MQGEGTGVIELNDGKVTGGDTMLAYTGSYVVDGDKFTAFITTERHTPGQPSVFGIGIDDVNLTPTGKSTPTTASCTGAAKQAPGLTFDATLIRIADQPRALPRAPTRAHSPAFVILNPSEIARRPLKKVRPTKRPQGPFTFRSTAYCANVPCAEEAIDATYPGLDRPLRILTRTIRASTICCFAELATDFLKQNFPLPCHAVTFDNFTGATVGRRKQVCEKWTLTEWQRTALH